MDIMDPSTGTVIAQTPCCTQEEVELAVKAANDAFPAWSDTPAIKRVQILYKFRSLVEEHLDELTYICARENGKVWEEAKGDILKVKEITEHACGIPSLMMGESLMNTSAGYDTVLYREPVGVFAGIAPFNFPGMIPMGWMMPLCIATGNTMVLKLASMTPMTSIRCLELMQEAGLPAGVINAVTCSRNEAEILLTDPAIRGVSFVGSTSIGAHVYKTAAASGKRVQALTEAKNHALVLEDAPLERTARGIINATFGCAGERCMALPVVVAQESIADKLTGLLVKYAKELKIGPAYDRTSTLGPVISSSHKEWVLNWIGKGISEGAKLVLDGRDVKVDGNEGGYYIGPTIFDHVTSGMTVGDDEIFGPVLCIKRVKDFEEGLAVMNANRFANGSVIFTQSGYYSREFAKRTDGGMVGINVGIPVPVGIFPFTGHKQSFFGDLHAIGKDGVRFFTETKAVTTRWFDDAEKNNKNVSTWDGSL
ncbi:CoA-acylating methylmalonate-semialdehyde dehydrogenase [Ruminiclostridium cellobioparum]|uniref:CoA-acylating methylmalonate-semialdehyde dehydrogenase n=1 Tax=Ruminiclostridium cellobioparum TaxID=29355 RepID=UPI0028AA006F|nr:CoA-acylating methylmalonate-semialdehyde dehydrogenase [Ruminiclostridium cellobioparum]